MRIDAIIPDAPQKSAISLTRLGHGQEVGELFDHSLPKLVVLEDESEDRDEEDREREEREEHAVRDRGGVLGAAIAEEVLDRAGQSGRDPADDLTEPVSRPACEAGEPPAWLHGAGLGHRLSLRWAPARPVVRLRWRRQNSPP
jgi:hypothetical protein